MDCRLSRAEREAVDAHRIKLCCARGIDVCFEDALANWNEFQSVRWREDRQRQYLAEQRAEIRRHECREGEEGGRERRCRAVLYHKTNNAAAWRNWYEAREEAVGASRFLVDPADAGTLGAGSALASSSGSHGL